MRILSTDVSYADVYPVKELKKKSPQMPARIFENKKDYDLTTFLLLPFVIDNDETGRWEKFYIKKGFINKYNEKRDACLLYLERGAHIHSQGSIKVSEVMPSQIIDHFYSWFYKDGKAIYSHEHTFNQELEGRIDVPLEIARELTAKIMIILEKRYETRLVFDRYREAYEKFFNQI